MANLSIRNIGRTKNVSNVTRRDIQHRTAQGQTMMMMMTSLMPASEKRQEAHKGYQEHEESFHAAPTDEGG